MLTQKGFQVVVLDQHTSTGDREKAYQNADAMVVGYEIIDAQIMSASPRLGVITTLSTGVDMIDIMAANHFGIRVCAVQPVATEDVAAHALALALTLERKIVETVLSTRSGKWDPIGYGAPRRLSGLTLGIVGLGRIGQKLAAMTKPIFGEVIGFDAESFEVPGVKRVDFDTLVSSADVISLHTPLTSSSRHMFAKEQFSRVKRGTTLVNVARGELIDTEALLDALMAGILGGAGLDVSFPEPLPADHKLRDLGNVLMTPHVAFASDVSLVGYSTSPAEAIIAWADQKPSAQTVTTGINERIFRG